jgi:hypothetical protein
MEHQLSDAGLSIEAFQNSNIGCGGRAPQLDAVGPDGLDGNFIDE